MGVPPKTRRKSPRAKIPLQRVSAEIQVSLTKEVISCRVFLTDLNNTGVGLFANTPLEKGTEISLVIEQPRHLFIKGIVAWCTPYTLDTKILSHETFNYRMGIKFLMDAEETEGIKKFIDEIYAADPLKPKSLTGTPEKK